MAGSTSPRRVGLIADTHGVLRERLVEVFGGCERILHAGDVGSVEVIEGLERIAPVTAVRGNVDGGWARRLATTASAVIGGMRILVVHDLATLGLDPRSSGVRVVVYGHSHVPLVDERSGVLFVNPGSAGPRRFSLPVTAGLLEIDGDAARAEIVSLVEAG
jgi:putative phosphoesterase